MGRGGLGGRSSLVLSVSSKSFSNFQEPQRTDTEIECRTKQLRVTLMATIVLSQMALYTFPNEPLPTKGPNRTSWKGVRSLVLEGSILHPYHSIICDRKRSDAPVWLWP